MTPDEEAKKMLRRERNKEAAARCRKRRLDQTMTLQDEVDMLDATKGELRKQLETLNSQKEELERVLKVHRSECAKITSIADDDHVNDDYSSSRSL